MFRSIFTAAALIAMVSASGTHAQDVYEGTRTVSLRKVDFRNADHVRALYKRLVDAAWTLCDDQPMSSAEAKADEACRAQVMRDAVAQVNEPAFLAFAAHATDLNYDGARAQDQLALNGDVARAGR